MNYEEIEKRVISIIAEVLEKDESEINADTNLIDTLEISSFEVFMLMSALEEEFDVTIKEELIREMFTIKDITRIIEKLIQEKRA